MSRPRARLLALAASAVLAAPAVAPAQSFTDQGKKRLPRLFTSAVADAVESTVRVQYGTHDAALGTAVSADGYVVTKGSEILTKKGTPRAALSCTLRDGSAYDAKLVGYHKDSDLALLKIDAVLKPVKFADTKVAAIGNWVAAAGLTSEPLAIGVVSAAARKLYGEEARVENLNKGALGIRLAELAEGTGVQIAHVEPNAAAFKAGLKAKDVIYELAGKAIKGPDTLIDALEEYKPGETVTVRIKRGEKELDLEVKLGARADFSRGDMQNSMGSALSGRRTGFPLVIQHDTVVRPTDCGGPLVDLDGKVLGVNIARAGRVETWALPGEVVGPIVKELRDASKASVATK